MELYSTYVYRQHFRSMWKIDLRGFGTCDEASAVYVRAEMEWIMLRNLKCVLPKLGDFCAGTATDSTGQLAKASVACGALSSVSILDDTTVVTPCGFVSYFADILTGRHLDGCGSRRIDQLPPLED